MSDYPKIMTRGGEEVSVGGAAEEAEKRAGGWASPLDGPPEAAVVAEEPSDATSDDEPTFGPPHDQTHRKRASKKR